MATMLETENPVWLSYDDAFLFDAFKYAVQWLDATETSFTLYADIDVRLLRVTIAGRNFTYDPVSHAPIGGVIEAVPAWGLTAIDLPVEGFMRAAAAGQSARYLLSGRDSIHGSHWSDEIRGFAGDDTLVGGAGDDLIDGGNGRVIRTEFGHFLYFDPAAPDIDDAADLISGEEGDDTATGGAGSDIVSGGEGADYLMGGHGNDRLAGDPGRDTLQGNQGADTVRGGDGADLLYGGQDNDRLSGDAGDDILNGNLGNDAVTGGAGDDTVLGGQGQDDLTGGDGDDWLSGDLGDDVMTGGSGADTFRAFGGGGTDRITDFDAAAGDRIQMQSDDFIVHQAGPDTVIDIATWDRGGGTIILVGVRMEDLVGFWMFQ